MKAIQGSAYPVACSGYAGALGTYVAPTDRLWGERHASRFDRRHLVRIFQRKKCQLNPIERGRLLRIYPVLRELPAPLLKKVETTAKPVRAPAGQRLFNDGSPCTYYPLLIEGIIRASKISPDGHEILLYRLYPGEICVITVVTLLGDVSYPAFGAAETALTLLAVPRSVFLEIVLECPAFRVFVFNALSQRIANLMALVDDVAFRRVDQRLASRLLLQRQPDTTTHQMLADELGTSREVVSRILETFQHSGMIRLGRKRIEILDRNALDRLHRVEGADVRRP
jgi:CRP/FNR family transcriptional regulator